MRSDTSSLAALLVVAACGATAGDVDVDAISPSSAPNVAPIPVQLDGAFARELTSDLDTGESGLAAVEVLIDDTPLTDVVWVSEGRIDGVIPAGLSQGRHDVTVRIGARSGTLEDGFAITGASLASTLAIPNLIGRGNVFTVTMMVMNNGVDAASAVAPSSLMTSGTATVALETNATGGVSLAAGAATTFTWTYRATTVGTIAFTGNATATDDLTSLAIESPVTSSNTGAVTEVTTIITDPLGDSSKFGYVVGYAGHVYVGPNDTGTAVSRLLPDTTGLETGITFTFPGDTTGHTSGNTAGAPYTSIGYQGCNANTAQCGPDNENSRGYFAAGSLGGTEWLVLGGGTLNNTVEYIYMTTDTDGVLDFRYVDLDAYLGANTHGFSAAHFLNDRLYLGFPDNGGVRPYLLALQVTPPSPGLDAAGTDAVDLRGDLFPGFNTPSPSMIDSLGDLNGLLYVGHPSGIYAATGTTPGAYSTTDWALSTPAFTEWGSKPSFVTTKQVDLYPSDRAIVGFASFKGRLFFGRNTTSGPQLWSCDPSKSTVATRCEPADWTLAAPNIVGDVQLTQFNNSQLTKISMVVATTQYLYVGFDSAQGVQVFRTDDQTALLPIAFEGEAGCMANLHPGSCQGIGGAGLGSPSGTKIFDARAITIGAQSSVWLTVGDGTGAMRLVMIP